MTSRLEHADARVYRCSCGSWSLAATRADADEIRAGQHIPTCHHLQPRRKATR
jgi:hypothetical protein